MRGLAGGHRLRPMLIERRTEAREVVELAVRLRGGGRAVTRNVSGGGLFLEIARHARLCDLIDFEIAFDTGWGELAFHARAEVVRLEGGSRGPGIGVRFVESQLVPLD